MTPEPIRAGVVGYGRIAEEIHCPLLSKLAGFELTAIYDATPARASLARQAYPGVFVPEAWEAFLGEANVELVVVSTPPSTHRTLALDALRAGRHVLVEKPFALSPTEVEEILEAGQRAERLVTCFQNRRWDRDFQAIREVVQSGKLGKLHSIESRMMFDFDPAWFELPGYRPWRLETSFGGGILYDLGPHQFDQLLQLVPSAVERVYCETRAWQWAREVENHYKCVLTFADGTLAQVEACQVAKIVAPRFYLIAELGTLQETDWISATPQILIDSGEPGKTHLEEVALLDTGPEDLYRALRASIRNGASLPVTTEQILRTARLIDSAYHSARTGQALQVHI